MSAAAALLFLVGFIGAIYLTGASWPSLAFAAMSVVGVLGIVDVAKRRIVLGGTELRIVSMWREQVYPRDTIASATWEGGVGAALKLTSGAWVRLPELGRNSQSVASTIQAWLRQTKPEPR